MPVKNRFAELLPEIAAWRRDLHENPEILFDTHRTAGIVAEKLRAFGCDEVVEGIGRTGVVGVIRGRVAGPHHRPARRHGRAADDRDHRPALRLQDARARCTPAAMTATPRCCSARRNTWPRRATSPAPASSSSSPPRRAAAAAARWSADGLMERWGIEEVYGMHNMPGHADGQRSPSAPAPSSPPPTASSSTSRARAATPPSRTRRSTRPSSPATSSSRCSRSSPATSTRSSRRWSRSPRSRPRPRP